MRKYLITIFIISLVLIPFVGASNNRVEVNNNIEKTSNMDFTHTVFAEESATTWCPNCPYSDEALLNIYQSGDYPFYYVVLVYDKNPNARQRNFNFVWNIEKWFSFPRVYFDGGDVGVGRSMNVVTTENDYREIIENLGSNSRKPVDLDMSVSWEGNAKIGVSVDVTFNGNGFYFGKLRSYVTEINSRWIDSNDVPFHYAFLDFAIDEPVFLTSGKTITVSATWDGSTVEDFGDITSDNIMVISTISHWIPHYRTGYEVEEWLQRYFAFYVDQTIGATPSIV